MRSMPFDFTALDFLILLVLFFYAVEGLSAGFVASFLDLVSFVASFALGLRFYSLFGKILVAHLAMPKGFANALGFFTAAILAEILLNVAVRVVASFLQRRLFARPSKALWETANRTLGFVPGLASAFILLSFLLTVFISLPLSPVLKNSINQSKIGSKLIAHTQGFEKAVNSVFGGAVSETISFLTVQPQTNEFVNLNFTTTTFSVDQQAEGRMMTLVNRERTARGLAPLVVDQRLKILARNYAKDMFTRGYFSHYTPEGTSPFDRMANAGIVFTFAGENLALAPSTELAHQGLMGSEGHRANILSPNFRKVGIGAIDGGIYGVMFVQEFTD